MSERPLMGAVLLLTLFSISAQASPGPWLRLLNPSQSASLQFGVAFSGQTPFVWQEDRSMRPASVSKVLTSGAALARLGEDFQFETEVRWEVDEADPRRIRSLTVLGSGDPTWGMKEFGESYESRLRDVVRELQSRGILEVHGPIRWETIDPRWSEVGLPEGWQSRDQLVCFGAPAGAFNLGLNCEVYLVTGSRSGRWRDSRIQDPVTVQVSTGATASLGVTLTPQGYRITGSLPRGQTAAFPLPVRRVDRWLNGILEGSLGVAGIRLSRDLPPFEKTRAESMVIRSVPLREILKPFMKRSLNLMGETLLLKLGEKVGSSAVPLREAGLTVLQEELERHVPGNGFRILDGSGLSRDSRVTPSGLFEVLKKLSEQPFFQSLWNAFTIAGVDGTLLGRMGGTSAQGWFRGKTGTLSGVANVVGYFPVQRTGVDRVYIPVVILGESKSGVQPLRVGADRVIVELTRLHRSEMPEWAPDAFAPESSGVNPFESEGISYDPRSSEGEAE